MMWNNALRELHELITVLYEQAVDCERIAKEVGLDITLITLDGLNVRHRWHNILSEAHKQEKVYSIIDTVLIEYVNKRTDLLRIGEAYQQQLTSQNTIIFNAIKKSEPSFKYSCFISFFHDPNNDLLNRIVKELCQGLTIELSTWMEQSVYLDEMRLSENFVFDEKISSIICQSACMIIVFMPKYFRQTNLYCTREYKAMEQLEKLRLSMLGNPTIRSSGLIVPVVFRGSLPAEIGYNRQVFTFDDFVLASSKLYKHPKYSKQIKDIAGYIAQRCDALENISGDFAPCHEFRLPSEEEALTFISQLGSSRTVFPLR